MVSGVGGARGSPTSHDSQVLDGVAPHPPRRRRTDHAPVERLERVEPVEPVEPVELVEPLEAVRLARDAGLAPLAPHVAHLLVTQLHGDGRAILDTARLLTPAQLAGHALVPDPLPVALGVRRTTSLALADCDDAARRILLVAAVAVVDSTDVLLRATGTSIGDVLASAAARHLHLVAGHAHIADPTTRAVVHDTASVSERTDAHRRLAAVHTELGRRELAVWHTALASLAGEPGLADDLLDVATALLRVGGAVVAQRVTREAASHATGATHVRALALGGVAALHAGHVADAVDLLREATLAEPSATLRGLLDVARGLAGTRSGDVAPSVAQACVRGLADAGRAAWLDGPPPAAHARAFAAVDDALALAASGRADAARDVLEAGTADLRPLPGRCVWDAVAGTGADAWMGAITPLVEACVETTGALADAWVGDLGAAASRLDHAAGHLPLALCGDAVALAGRLGALRHGDEGELAAALEALLPIPVAPGVRSALLANRAHVLLAHGKPADAATLLDLSDAVAPSTGHRLPGLTADEVRVLDPGCSVGRGVDPQAAAGPTRSASGLDRACELLVSGVRGTRSVGVGTGPGPDPGADAGAAAVDLRTAVGLFDEAGAHALADLTRRFAAAEPLDLPPGGTGERQAVVRPGPVPAPDPEALDWEALDWEALTARERDVALAVGQGASNRLAARALGVSIRTVEVHLTSIFRKVGVGSRTELAVRVARGLAAGPASRRR